MTEKRCFPRILALAALVLLVVLAGCATKGPQTVGPPTVEVTELRSTVFTPDVVKFEARIVIRNQTRDAMEFDRVDYSVDLFSTELFSSSFDQLLRTKSRGQQTVTFPFQIAMKDIAGSAVDLLDQGTLQVTFRGRVYPDPAAGFSSMPFEQTIQLPIPRIPTVSYDGAEGIPLSDGFRVRLRVQNPNAFEVAVDQVDTYLELNDHRYTLVHSVERTNIEPNGSGVVVLQMENTTGKGLSMILNTIQARQAQFSVGGSVTGRTPYGWVYIPIEVTGRAQ